MRASRSHLEEISDQQCFYTAANFYSALHLLGQPLTILFCRAVCPVAWGQTPWGGDAACCKWVKSGVTCATWAVTQPSSRLSGTHLCSVLGRGRHFSWVSGLAQGTHYMILTESASVHYLLWPHSSVHGWYFRVSVFWWAWERKICKWKYRKQQALPLYFWGIPFQVWLWIGLALNQTLGSPSTKKGTAKVVCITSCLSHFARRLKHHLKRKAGNSLDYQAAASVWFCAGEFAPSHPGTTQGPEVHLPTEGSTLTCGIHPPPSSPPRTQGAAASQLQWSSAITQTPPQGLLPWDTRPDPASYLNSQKSSSGKIVIKASYEHSCYH